MAADERYTIHTEARFGPLERFDIGRIRDETTEDWLHQTLVDVNNCSVRMAVVQGEFHWHHHDKEDECFFALSGRLFVDLEEESVELGPGQGIMVPSGVRHRTRAPERTTILMVSGAGIKPTGD